MRGVIRALACAAGVSVLLACGSDNVIGPRNQLQVGNLTDDFQFQVSNMAQISQTLTYNWSNTADSANINQSSAVTGGSARLIIRSGGAIVYQGNLASNGTFHSAQGASGTWQIQVVLDKADGMVNFRVQRAP